MTIGIIPEALTCTALVLWEVFRNAPQNVRTAKRRNTAGLSPTSIACRTATATGWVLYLVTEGNLPAICSSIVSLILVALLYLQVCHYADDAGYSIISGISLLIAEITVFVFNAQMLGQLLALSTLIFGVPALVAAFRSSSLDGVSPISLVVGCLDAVIFGAYGFAFNIPGYVTYGICFLVCYVPILAKSTLSTA